MEYETQNIIENTLPKKKGKLKIILPVIIALVLIGAALLYFFVLRINVKPQYDTVVHTFCETILTEDGSVLTWNMSKTPDEVTDGWDDVIEIKQANYMEFIFGYCIGLTKDGDIKICSPDVSSDEKFEILERETDELEHIKDIAATRYNLYFLNKDGTVEVIDLLKAFDLESEELTKITKKIKKLNDVAAIEANDDTFVAIKKDGTVSAFNHTGYIPPDSYKTKKINKWKNIEKIKMTYDSVIGIRKDGTLICEGNVNEDELESWKGIKDLSADGSVGVKTNGKLVTTLNIDVDDVKDIEKVYYLNNVIVGIKKDGTKEVVTFAHLAHTTETETYERIKAN